MLCTCYILDIITATSISAIATNGTVKGGGAYYLVSRTLGPEFGGAIGVVYYLGAVFNTGMNSVGLINCVMYNFGRESGLWRHWFPESFWWSYLWSTVVLILCTLICLAGSSAFSKTSNGLLVVLLIAILSIPVSALAVKPFQNTKAGVEFTGISLETLKQNLYPHFTKGADGSNSIDKESWKTLFGVLFPATAGIFAGASMSGDLKKPSKSIPAGTFISLAFTFVIYNLVLFSLGSTVTRQSLYANANLVQAISIKEEIIMIGEFATTFFGALMGIIGAAKLLQALARDNLIPGLSIFAQGSGRNDEPRNAVIVTYLLAQCTMLFKLNQLAVLVTMALVLTFLVTNLACFTLRITGAANFRPSFKLFSWQTAVVGFFICCSIMVFIDPIAAFGSIAILITIFLIIHYASPPKPWGDVSQGLIFHQVRKYLLRLKQEHVKFWRPSFLIFVNDPRKHYKLIQFTNSLKKGGLLMLGHVIVTDDFKSSVTEIKHQQSSWNKYIDFSKIKAFTTITVAPKIEWGIRNLVLSSGLGSMRPNIVMLGFYNPQELRKIRSLVDVPSTQQTKMLARPQTNKSDSVLTIIKKKPQGSLPTDRNRPEIAISAQSYVTVLEDLIRGVKVNVAIAKGFENFQLPEATPDWKDQLQGYFKKTARYPTLAKTRYIDLWPVQMSAFAFIDTENHEQKKVLTSNFDTYTMILQLGSILSTADGYDQNMKLRVSAFVEYENEVEQEKERLKLLLQSIRINAEVRVFWLASGDLKTYEVIVNGVSGDDYSQAHRDTNDVLHDESWWQEVASFRREELSSFSNDLAELQDNMPVHGNLPSKPRRPDELAVRRLQRLLQKAKKRISKGRFNDLQSRMRVQLSHLDADLIAAYDSASDEDEDHSDVNSTPGSFVPSAIASPVASISPHGQGRGQSPHRGQNLLAPRPPALDRLGSSNTVSSPITIGPRSPTLEVAPHPASSSSAPRASGIYSPDRGTASLTPSRGASPSRSGSSSSPSLRKPPPMRHQSLPKFTSSPVPATRILNEDTEVGERSIMFTEDADDEGAEDRVSRGGGNGNGKEKEREPQEEEGPLRPAFGFPAIGLTRAGSNLSIQRAQQASETPTQPVASSSTVPTGGTSSAAGYPAQRAMPLSFNDLPSRAQHLILNELMTRYSSESAVLFTTLPGPIEGTGESEEESGRYLGDLEVLVAGLPPVLMVHSNMVTVTVSL
jgi:potassium/chloride transporter 9